MYFLYILQCSDGSFYTGITTNLERRVKEHNNSKLGAKYTKVRRPVELIYSKEFLNQSEASIQEARIKKLSRAKKYYIFSISSIITYEQKNYSSVNYNLFFYFFRLYKN